MYTICSHQTCLFVFFRQLHCIFPFHSRVWSQQLLGHLCEFEFDEKGGGAEIGLC